MFQKIRSSIASMRGDRFSFAGYMVFAAGIITIGFFTTAITVYAATPTVTSAKITGPNIVTIIYSEAVYTNLADYSNFYGSLNGRNLTAISGTGSNTIILTFDGSTFASNASGWFTIASTTVSTSDSYPFSEGTINVTDGQIPVISSVNFSSNNTNNTFTKVGNTITLTFSVNESISSSSVTIAGHGVYISGSGTGPYTASYTVVSGDIEDSVPAKINFYDLASNVGKFSINFETGDDNVAPVISSITSNATSAGVLEIGDSITFTLTPSSAEPNAAASGYYNGVPLVWTTYNSGYTYVATYTVASGNSSQTYPLQISGVTLTDAAGNTSNLGIRLRCC